MSKSDNKKYMRCIALSVLASLSLVCHALTQKKGVDIKKYLDPQHLPIIPNMNSMVLIQQTPQNTLYREFYANNVELEPVTLILCGRPIEDKSQNIIGYKKVDPNQVKNIRFYADSGLTLDPQYNPNNTIPLMHNDGGKKVGEKNWRYPDIGEPMISDNDSKKKPILVLYDETSNYYHLYEKEGFMEGGTTAARPYYTYEQRSYKSTNKPQNLKILRTHNVYSVFDDSPNKCFPEQDPGVGETTIRLHLLATKALQSHTSVNIYAEARVHLPKDNSSIPPEPAKDETVNEGALTYTIAPTPGINQDDLIVGQSSGGSHFKRPGSFFSLFSTGYNLSNGYMVEEGQGNTVCDYILGSPMHQLWEHSDLRYDLNGARKCRRVIHVGSQDCPSIDCRRGIRISYIKLNSKVNALHDFYSPATFMGANCKANRNGYTGHFFIKPLLKSESNARDDTDNFFHSLLGGVGAFFYKKNIGDNFKNRSTGVLGGNAQTYYVYSYAFGEGAQGHGLKCGWNSSIKAMGHDMYGNSISIDFVPAIGEFGISLKSVNR